MKYRQSGIRTSFAATDIKHVRRHLWKTYKRGVRLGPYLAKNHDGTFTSRVMVYTNEHDWLEYKLKHGHELDKAVAGINSFTMGGGSMSSSLQAMQSIGRGRRSGKSAMTTIMIDKALREGKTVGYMNLEMDFERMEIHERVHKNKPALAE